MAKGMYMGVGNVAKKVKKLYIGVDGKARKIKKMYIGVNGVARLFWSGGGTATGSFAVDKAVDFTSKSFLNASQAKGFWDGNRGVSIYRMVAGTAERRMKFDIVDGTSNYAIYTNEYICNYGNVSMTQINDRLVGGRIYLSSYNDYVEAAKYYMVDQKDDTVFFTTRATGNYGNTGCASGTIGDAAYFLGGVSYSANDHLTVPPAKQYIERITYDGTYTSYNNDLGYTKYWKPINVGDYLIFIMGEVYSLEYDDEYEEFYRQQKGISSEMWTISTDGTISKKNWLDETGYIAPNKYQKTWYSPSVASTGNKGFMVGGTQYDIRGRFTLNVNKNQVCGTAIISSDLSSIFRTTSYPQYKGGELSEEGFASFIGGIKDFSVTYSNSNRFTNSITTYNDDGTYRTSCSIGTDITGKGDGMVIDCGDKVVWWDPVDASGTPTLQVIIFNKI